MEKMSPQPQRSPSTVPLAHDQDGNPIELPEGAAGWRVRRQTGGRPRLLLDSKKQPMLFALDYTIADVEDILPPGSYLLDVVDKNGEPLGVTIGLSIGTPRNAEPVEPEDESNAPAAVPTTLPSTTSDVRLVLEANVRATQMAFLHNQRTLELGLRMAETLRDSVQVLAGSQAEWIKSISSARGFFRNAAPQVAPVEVKQLTVAAGRVAEDDDEEDEDDDEDDGEDLEDGAGVPPAAPHWSEQFMPIIQQVVMQLMPAISAWSSRQMADAKSRRSGADNDGIATSVADAAADGHAAAAARQARAVQVADAIRAACSPGPGINVLRLLQLLPPEIAAKLMKVQTTLSSDEQADAMQILRQYDPEEMRDLLVIFDATLIDDCVAFLRRLIAEGKRMQAARRTRDKGSPGGGGASGGGAPGGGAASGGGASGGGIVPEGAGGPGGAAGPNSAVGHGPTGPR